MKAKRYFGVVKRKDKVIKVFRRSYIRRFGKQLGMIKWEKGTKVYLRVDYGKHEDNFGKMVEFYNDGWVESKSELMKMYKAFVENGGKR